VVFGSECFELVGCYVVRPDTIGTLSAVISSCAWLLGSWWCGGVVVYCPLVPGGVAPLR